MTKPKIIFFDIDGTLVPLKEGIRPRTVEALQKLRQNGIKICIAIGHCRDVKEDGIYWCCVKNKLI